MNGQNFPLSEHLRPHILDGRTISRAGVWWTAVLAVEDPTTGRPFIGLYKWQKRNGEWKKASSFKINSAKHAATLIESLLALQTVWRD